MKKASKDAINISEALHKLPQLALQKYTNYHNYEEVFVFRSFLLPFCFPARAG
jgi:hypothetical protein